MVGRAINEIGVAGGGVCLLTFLLLGLVTGCQLEYLSERESSQSELTGAYDRAILKQSGSLEVLITLEAQSGALGADGRSAGQLRRGHNVIAHSGESRNGSERWFTLFVFDEGSQTISRKYRFHLDEKSGFGARGGPFELSTTGGSLVFEGSLVLAHDFGGQGRPAYDRDIATFRYIASRLHFDCKKLAGSESAARSRETIVTVLGLLMNQVFRAALLELEASPHLASALATEEGMAFEHLTLDHGRAHLRVNGDVAEVRLEVGLSKASKPRPTDDLVARIKSLL